MKKIFFVLTISLFILNAGCGPKQETPSVTSSPAGEVKEAPAGKNAVDAATAGVLKGKVLFEGSPPAPKEISVRGNPECAALHPGGVIASEELLVKDGALQNVFVYVKEGLEGYHFDAPAEPVTIQNTKCQYVPHVSGAQVGQPVILLNNDATLHNIHSYSKNSKTWNLGLPFQGMKQTKKFDAPEVMVALKCDVHPWMQGYVGVLPHPYFSVTDESGNFEIKNLPPGEYTACARHEKLGIRSQKIKIEPRETKEIEFKFSLATNAN